MEEPGIIERKNTWFFLPEKLSLREEAGMQTKSTKQCNSCKIEVPRVL